MRRITTIQDVVDWGLCVGCGACYSACDRGAVSLVHIEPIGIRPRFKTDYCSGCTICLSSCPGYHLQVVKGNDRRPTLSEVLIGPTLEIWEGYAQDPEVRHRASSGGILSALSLYCLEKEQMNFVLHTAMDSQQPWRNATVFSVNRGEVLSRAGSRYGPSSPCDSLRFIEESSRPCVFIGKPCDTAAVSMLRRTRPNLDKNLGLVLTFFCAGPPSSQATMRLVRELAIELSRINEIQYRGNGWPGRFRVLYDKGAGEKTLTYEESWGYLAKQRRPFRCHLCPDGLGELADISGGDAWHRHSGSEDQGESLVLVRTERGREILMRAAAAGYVSLQPSGPAEVIAAQGLIRRRCQAFGRLLGMKLLLVPTPSFQGFHLLSSFMHATSPAEKIRSVAGTTKRLIRRGLWHRNPLFKDFGSIRDSNP